MIKEDIITTDKYLEAFPETYYKTDVIVNKETMIWRNQTIYPPEKYLPILISGHSDYSIQDKDVEYYSPKRWYTVNKETDNQNVHSLPLGITNNTNESELHPIYGNLDIMIEIMNEDIRITNLVYMNFNVNTFYEEREKVYNWFKDKEWVTIGNIQNTIEGRKIFLREIKSHTFVLCPRGNGIDTHRLWETLYLGRIPIVLKHIANQDFRDLPICFIDDWNMITESFLEKEKVRISSQTFSLEKLKISYWINKIRKN
jgi:hypothetical protein